MKKLLLLISIVFTSFLAVSQNTGSLPYYQILQSRDTIIVGDTLVYHEEATGKYVKVSYTDFKNTVLSGVSTSIIAEAPLSYINDTLKVDTTKVPYFSGGISGPKNSSTYLNGVGVWDTINVGVTSITGTTNRITSTGGATPVIDIDASYVGQSSITTLGTIGTGVWNAGAVTSSGAVIGASLRASGSGGAGYLQLPFQTATPTAVSGSMILYSDGSNRFSIVRRNNANSADITRTHSYPDQSGTWTFPTPASGSASTLAGLETAQTFTHTNTFVPVQRFSAAGFTVNDGTNNILGWYSSSTNLIRTDFPTVAVPILTAGTRVTVPSSQYDVNGIAHTANFALTTSGTLLSRSTSSSTYSTLSIGGGSPSGSIGLITGNYTASNANINSGDITMTTGNVTNASALSSQSSGSYIISLGTAAGSAKRGNIQLLGGTSLVNMQGMQLGMYWGNATVAPSGNPSAGFYAWSALRNSVASTSGLNLRSESGTTYIFSDNMGVNTLNPSEKLEVIGNIKGAHLIGNTSTPSIAAGAGAGTSPTVSVTGTDMGGYITVTTGTIPTLSAIVATITFNTAYGSAPRCIQLTPAGANSAMLSGVNMIYVDQAGITTTTFDITSGTTALTAATTYKWYYSVIQ